eukprot:scaffold187681_cov29-Tisochrysis_lutea.AAC.3
MTVHEMGEQQARLCCCRVEEGAVRSGGLGLVLRRDVDRDEALVVQRQPHVHCLRTVGKGARVGRSGGACASHTSARAGEALASSG